MHGGTSYKYQDMERGGGKYSDTVRKKLRKQMRGKSFLHDGSCFINGEYAFVPRASAKAVYEIR